MTTAGKGFTLIELSIVLVIIGLIVGGVLVGRDLIEAASIRAQIKQFNTYKLALNTFKLKYNCLPGDCAIANNFGLGTNGNGNELLEAADTSSCAWVTDGNLTTPDCDYNGELTTFMQHLAAATLIEGSYDGTFVLGRGYPATYMNTSAGMIAAGLWHTGMAGTVPSQLNSDYHFPPGFWLHANICDQTRTIPGYANNNCGVFTPAQMNQMDTKIDDGKPLSGNFWGYTNDELLTSCLDGTFTNYALTVTTLVCQASYRLY